MTSNLEKIIRDTIASPTIVNNNSNYVVTTYWWGRGNLNGNTARPCVAFYETFFNSIKNLMLKFLNTTLSSQENNNKINSSSAKQILENLEIVMYKSTDYENITIRKAKSYMEDIYNYTLNYSEKNNREDNKNILAIKAIEKFKTMEKTPESFEFKDLNYVQTQFKIAGLLYIIINKCNIFKLFKVNRKVKELKDKFLNREELSNTEIKEYKLQLEVLAKEKADLISDIKKSLTAPQSYSQDKINKNIKLILENDSDSNFDKSKINLYIKDFQNKSVYSVMNEEFRYLSPIKFEDMIKLWENKCKENKCNFMAIEYDEFAKPGGYQMAINAKPLFIKKALELCGSKNVLYIDGDMTINKYPVIFDMTDVDFMARGWWIDARSSYKMDESILYDPYTFETSGGTMFFSQSHESKKLIDCWIEEANKPHQQGKADDRILSLVFNTKKFLLNMKILQLPIEYLWLSLDYDERMLENVYDYDTSKMENSIYIEHPECLTTEDTAVGAGSSSDRTPKYYMFLEDLMPVSEEVQEYVMFNDKKFSNVFDDYYKFMGDITYLDDGNPLLYQKGFVDQSEPGNNESPLYITKYEHRYGTKPKNYDGEKYSPNEVVAINTKRARKIRIKQYKSYKLYKLNNDTIEINTEIKQIELIPLIISLLNTKKNVLYNPIFENGYNSGCYTSLIDEMNKKYHNLDFIFVPEINGYHMNNIFKPKIALNQPILFRHGSHTLIQLLSTVFSLEEISYLFEYGSYQYISRMRIGYLTKPKQVKGGGSIRKYSHSQLKTGEDVLLKQYEDGLNYMYENESTSFPVTSIKNITRKSRLLSNSKSLKSRSLTSKSLKSRSLTSKSLKPRSLSKSLKMRSLPNM
jgi:hypothetical protein